MRKYGIIVNGSLITSDTQLDGYKPVKYAEVPDFDQLTQAVMQGDVVDDGEVIHVGVNIIDLEIDINEPDVNMP
jgi:hypothetical protein